MGFLISLKKLFSSAKFLSFTYSEFCYIKETYAIILFLFVAIYVEYFTQIC